MTGGSFMTDVLDRYEALHRASVETLDLDPYRRVGAASRNTVPAVIELAKAASALIEAERYDHGGTAAIGECGCPVGVATREAIAALDAFLSALSEEVK